MAQPVFHVSAKHPQEEHVSEDVQKAAMQKHAGHQRHDGRTQLRAGMRQSAFRAQGNQAKLLHEQVSGAGREGKLINEHEKIRHDQQDIHDRERTARRFAPKRYHVTFTFYLNYLSATL